MNLWNLLLYVPLTGLLLLIIAAYGYYSNRGISVESLVSSWHLRFNYFLNTLVVPLFIFFTAVTFASLNLGWAVPGLWIICVMFFSFQTLILLLSNRLMYIYRLAWIISTLISLGLSFGLTRLLVYLGDTVIPSRVVLSSLLWALSSLLLLYSIKEFLPYRFYDFKAQQHHVTNLYKKYQKRYSAHLEEAFQKDVQLRRLFFAILVTEDLNRPLVFRTFERLFFRFGFINTTGIMQVTSPRKLSDRKSVELAQNMILGSYNNHRVNEKIEYMLVRAVAFDYNNGDFYRELIVDTYYNLKAYDATLE